VDRSFLAFVLGPIWLPVVAAAMAVHDVAFQTYEVSIAMSAFLTVVGLVPLVYAGLLLFGLPVFLILKRKNLIEPVGAFLIGAFAGPIGPWILFFILGPVLHH